MMKQTSGAISFLLSAYRAILHKNFLAGLMIAAMGASAACAASRYEIGTVTYDGNANSYGSQFQNGRYVPDWLKPNYSGEKGAGHFSEYFTVSDQFFVDTVSGTFGERNWLAMTDLTYAQNAEDKNFNIASGKTVTITNNAKVDGNGFHKFSDDDPNQIGGDQGIYNQGTLKVTNGSHFYTDIIQNNGTIEVSNHSIFFADIVNNGKLTVGSADAPAYIYKGMLLQNNAGGVTTFENMQLMAPSEKYSSIKDTGITDYTAYTFEQSNSGKTANTLLYYSGDENDGAPVLMIVKGGSVNIKNSYLAALKGEMDIGILDDEENKWFDSEFGMDWTKCLQSGNQPIRFSVQPFSDLEVGFN